MIPALRCLLALICSVSIAFAADPKHTYMPPKGYVADAATAIKIAVAVWEPIYGRKQIEGEKPFTAVLRNGIWTVQGSLPLHAIGGVALAEIARKDGRILRVTHGK